MKYKILFLSVFCSLASANLSADSESKNTEKELMSILEGLNNSDKKTLDTKTIQEQFKESVDNRKVTKQKVIDTKHDTMPKVESKENKIASIDKDLNINKISVDKNIEEQFSEKEVFETNINENSHIYLLNIPIDTTLYALKDFYMYPYRDGMIFDDGKISAASPLKYTDETSYCYFALEKSGHVRRLKAIDTNNLDRSKGLKITANKSEKSKVKSHLDPSKIIESYETTFFVNNQHVKAIKCITTEKTLPMNIDDFNKETGNIFSFEFPPVVDIL